MKAKHHNSPTFRHNMTEDGKKGYYSSIFMYLNVQLSPSQRYAAMSNLNEVSSLIGIKIMALNACGCSLEKHQQLPKKDKLF